MALFKFRLAPMLRLREHVKEQKYWELRSLHETRRQMVREIDALERELAKRDLDPTEGQIFAPIDLQLRADHSQSLDRQIRSKRETLAKLDEQLAAKRAELVEAMRAVKSLEQLRQRQEDRHRREQNAAEQKFGDEVALRKYSLPEGRKKIPS